MAVPILTNELLLSIDRVKFDHEYDLFEVATDEKYFDRGAGILDSGQKMNRILAILFSGGNRFYVMAGKYEITGSELVRVLKETSAEDSFQEAEHITVSQVSAARLTDPQLTQIMLNALGNYLLPELGFCNLTGHLYFASAGKMVKAKRDGKQTIIQVPCIDVRVDSSMRLQLQVRTFTNLTEVRRITFAKRQSNQYPHYTLTDKSTLKRIFRLNPSGRDADASRYGVFIPRTPENRKKTSYDFLRIDKKNYEDTKMYVLAQVMKLFRKRYEGIAEIHFRAIEDYMSIVPDTQAKMKKLEHERAAELLQSRPLILIDRIEDDDSKALCGALMQCLEEQYGVKAKLRKRLNENAWNLCVIHNKAYYQSGKGKAEEDLHTVSDRFTVQHVTLEDTLPECAGNGMKNIVDVLVAQLLIKSDIIQRKMTLYDWTLSGLSETVLFGQIREGEFNPDRKQKASFLDMMKIAPDGSIDFQSRSYEQADLFLKAPGPDYFRILETAKEKDKKTIGFVQYADGTIDIIKDPGWYTIPEAEKLMEKLDEGDTSLRGKAVREEYLGSVTDIKGFSDHGKDCFFAGVIGNGMNQTIPNAVHIRTIESASGRTTRMKELLPLLDVLFVRNGQLSVMPFPFKYLREYGYMQQK